MAKIMIPKCRNPFVVIMNGIRYEYESGKEVEVPDEVAEVIQFHVDSKPKALPIIGGSGPCGLPHVYFSDSADKLPADAVDGSLAVVESESDILGTWRFKETLFQPSQGGDVFNAVFRCDGQTYVAIETDGNYWYYSSMVGDFTEPVYRADWENESYKTITIIAESYDDNIRTLLNNYAERVSGGHTLYSRINGEWVNQGEVDVTDLASV